MEKVLKPSFRPYFGYCLLTYKVSYESYDFVRGAWQAGPYYFFQFQFQGFSLRKAKSSHLEFHWNPFIALQTEITPWAIEWKSRNKSDDFCFWSEWNLWVMISFSILNYNYQQWQTYHFPIKFNFNKNKSYLKQNK